MILNEEVKYWNDLSLEFMTEESDDEDDPNCIIEHKLPWYVCLCNTSTCVHVCIMCFSRKFRVTKLSNFS